MKPDIHNSKSICRYVTRYLFPLFVLLMTNSAIGQITLSKTVVQSGCNQYNVTVSATGVATPEPVDVMLVIDCSGSMGDGSPTPLSYAKTAAINFVRNLFKPANDPGNINRVGLVTFTSEATLSIPLRDETDSSSIISTINGLVASGNTNIADGFYQAEKQLKSKGRRGCNVIRSMVLMTDGVSNYGYQYSSGTDQWTGACAASDPTTPDACTNEAYLQGQAAWSFTSGDTTLSQ